MQEGHVLGYAILFFVMMDWTEISETFIAHYII